MGLLAGIASRIRTMTGPRILVAAATAYSAQQTNQNTPPYAITRWQLSDSEDAIRAADGGNLRQAAQLCSALRRDGTLAGVLSTRTEGLVHLPVRYTGDERMVALLQSDLSYLAPSAELALMAGDGILLGLGLAELVQQPGYDLPSLRRLDPEFLQYRWADNTWWYQSVVGLQMVTPGDGRWVLHMQGGANMPWRHGLWSSLSRAAISKDHAFFLRENYASKLANAARVAYSSGASTDAQRIEFFRKLAGWGPNSVFDLPPGWEIKIIESNGQGYQVFSDIIKTSNEEITITLAGQLPTTTGGTGFSNSAIHQSIRSDLIQSTANALAWTLNEQVIPVWGFERFGPAGVVLAPRIAWDVTPPKDRAAEANAISALGAAITTANAALEAYGRRVDAVVLAGSYGLPLLPIELDDATADAGTVDDDDADIDITVDDEEIATSLLELTPSDSANITTVEEGRNSNGFGPLLLPDGSRDPDNSLTIAEFVAKRKQKAEVTGQADGQEEAVVDGVDVEIDAA